MNGDMVIANMSNKFELYLKQLKEN